MYYVVGIMPGSVRTTNKEEKTLIMKLTVWWNNIKKHKYNDCVFFSMSVYVCVCKLITLVEGCNKPQRKGNCFQTFGVFYGYFFQILITATKPHGLMEHETCHGNESSAPAI